MESKLILFKKWKILFLACLVITTFSTVSIGQMIDPPIDPEYDGSLKVESIIQNEEPISAVYEHTADVNIDSKDKSISRSVACVSNPNWVDLPSASALSSNDDGSMLVSLPFSFEFDGTSYTQVYINNNGNLTFGNSFGSFTASGFPISTAMIAPFWADVDTRCATCGSVEYLITGGNTLTVTWNQVGFYNSNSSLLNTFQVIITDGSDSSIPGNVRFNYCDMQWTTGDFSGGSGGLGGSSAISGINAGGTDGLFNQTGSYNDASVSNLNGTSQDFNVSSSVIISALCQDISVSLDDAGSYTVTSGEIDNGSTAFDGIQSLAIDPSIMTCADLAGPVTVTLTVTDNNGETGTCTSQVTVTDGGNPTAICQDVTVSLDMNGNGSLTAGDVDNGSTDACDTDLDLSIDVTTFDCSMIGTPQTVTLTATDDAGNTDMCTSTITVIDEIAPDPVCDQNSTTTLDSNGERWITASQLDSDSDDNCTLPENLSFSYSPTDINLTDSLFTCEDVGLNMVNIWVWDESGNVSETCFAQLNVIDNTAPDCITQDITVNLDASGDASIVPADVDNGSSDACGIQTMSVSPNTFDCSNLGDNTVTLTLTDVNGNVSSCNAIVHIDDITPPTAVCQDITVQLDAAGTVSITPNSVDGGSMDVCGISNLDIDVSTFGCANVGDNTVTLSVTDIADPANVATCTSTVTVQDNVPPTANCQNIIVQLDDTGNASIMASMLDGGSTDACGIDASAYSATQTSFTCDDIGDVIVTLTVVDNYGNEASCDAIITIEDNVEPTANCQDITIQLNSDGIATIEGMNINNGSEDACGIDTMYVDAPEFDCNNVGDNTVTLTVVDNNGNEATCTSNVTVEDNVAPEAICQNITIQLNDSGVASIVAADVDNGSNDACGIESLSVDISDFTCADVGGNTVTLTVLDNNGNEATCSATVTVEDNVAPEAICQNITIQLDEDGMASIEAMDINNGSNDACGIDTMYVDIPNFTCADVDNPVVVTLTVVDNNANESTCNSTVTVEDNVDPECSAMDITVVLDALGNYTVEAEDIDDGSSDACGIESYEIRREFTNFFGGTFFGNWNSEVDFSCNDVGNINVQLRITDNNGNQSICDAVVTINDETSPFMNCQDNITVSLNSDGEGALVGINLLAWWGIFDACGIDQILVDGEPIKLYSCADLGTQSVVVTSIDNNGNQTQCTVDIEVRDEENPECETMDITIYLDAAGVASIDSNAVDNGSSDNCTINSITLDNQDFDCSMVGENTVTQTVEDQSGNTSTCEAIVTVVDTIDPICITMDIVVQLDENGEASIDSNAVDNGSNDACGIASIVLDIQDFTCSDVDNPVTVTQTVTDVNGNISTCTATVSVEDNVAPMVTCNDITVQLDVNGEVAVTGEMVAGTVTVSTADITGGNNSPDTIGDPGETYYTAPLASAVTIDIDWIYNTTDGDGPSFDLFGYHLNGSFFQLSDDGGAVSQSGSFTITLNPGDTFGPQMNTTDNFLGAASGTFFGIDFSGDLDPSNWTLTNINADGFGSINPGVPSSTDACGIASYEIDMASFDCSNVGDNDVTVVITDVNGNSASCMSTVTVEDNVAPEAICQDITVELDDNGEVTITGAMIDGGSEDACGIASLAASPSVLTCDDLGGATVTLTVEDVNGNISTCEATVTVEDNIAPTMECQDITVILDSDGNGTISPLDVDNGSSDNCGIVEWAVGPAEVGCETTDYSEFTLLGDHNGHRYYASNNTMTWSEAYADAIEHGGNLAAITDAAENSFIATAFPGRAYIGFNDELNEGSFVWTTGEDNSYTSWLGGEPNNLGGEDYAEINFNANGMWNDLPTGIDLPYILEVSITDDNEISVVLIGTDQSGNEASCLSVATLSDVTPPVALCQNITVLLDEDGAATIDNNAVDNGSFDACGIATYNTSQTTFGCADVGDVSVVLTVIDNYGNESTCNATVTIEDNVDPVAICQDITVELDFNGDVTITGEMIDGGSMDACGIESLDAGLGTTDLDCSNVGENTITLTVTDVNGNTSQCDATVTVEDNTAPLVNCVNNVEVPLNSDGIGFVTKEEVTGATFDACGIVDTFIIRNDNASHPDYGIENEMLFFSCDDIGLVDVIIRVYDANGNVEECNTAVNVKDEIAPIMECTSATIYLDDSGVAALDSNALDDGSTDNCTIVEFSVSQTDFDCSHLGMNLIIMTAEDQSGNTNTCANGVIVLDTIKPTPMCMDITVQLDDTGSVSIVGSDIDGGSTDNCSVVSLTASPNEFTCANVGENTVTLTVEDQSGNTSTCSAIVTVEDNVSPIVECVPSTINLEMSDTNGTNATVTPGQLLSQSVVIKGSNADTGSPATTNYSVVVTVPTVLDFFWFYSSNNSSPVFDNFGYTINGVYTQLSDDSGALTQSGSAAVALNPTDVFALQVIATDDRYGRATGSITGFDLSGDFDPANWTLDNSTGADGSAYTNNSGSGAIDACGIASITIDKASFDCSEIGDHTVTVTAIDVNGNSSSCQSIVTVQDVDAPIASCMDIIVQLNELGVASIDSNSVDGGSFDGCTVSSITTDITEFTCADLGANTVVMTVTDQSGNESTCTATVTVEDNVDPMALCQDITVQLDDLGNASIVGSDIDGGSSDACGIASMTAFPSSFTCAEIGANTVILTVIDNNGNESTCEATVTVEDNVEPEAICAAYTVQLDDSGNASIDASNVDGGSADACGIASMSLSPNSFTCAEVGENTVTLTVIDNNGNESSCEATVTVEDNVAPVAMCMNIIVELDANGLATIDSNAVDGGSTDACGIASFETSQTSFDCSNLGDNTVEMIVTDVNDNDAVCSATVTVIDVTGPELTCPADIIVNTLPSDCNQNVIMPTLFPVDVCSGSATYEYVAVDITFIETGTDTFALFPVGDTEVTVIATDGFGNTSDCTFNVTVIDNIDPIITGCEDIGDITVDSDMTVCGANVSWDETLINANDNCSGQGAGVIITSDYNSGDLFPIGTTTVTYTATDDSGNTAVCTFDVTVNPALPVADFTNLPTSLSVIFTNTSANATSYSWDFGDSNSSTDENPTHAYAAAGTYTVCLTAENPCEDMDTYCEDVTVANSGECLDVVTLNAGWNLISFDVDPADNTLASIFADEITSGNLVMITGYNSTDGAVIFDPLLPPFLNTLTSIEPGYGYWVNVVDASSISLVGDCIDVDFKIDLATGWNLISYIPQTPTPPQVYFSNLITNNWLDLVTGYDMGSKIYDPSFPIPALNTLTDLENGFGYWVKVNTDVAATDWLKGSSSSSSARNGENLDNWGNLRTSSYDFVSGTVEGIKDGERINVINEAGDLIVELEVFQNGFLQLTPLYGDDSDTPDEIDGLVYDQTLYFEYGGIQSEVSIDFKGSSKVHFVELEFESLTTSVSELAYDLSANLAPNPMFVSTTLSLEVPQTGNFTIQLIDMTGKKVKSIHNGLINAGHFETTIERNDLIGGQYIISVIGDAKDSHVRIPLLIIN